MASECILKIVGFDIRKLWNIFNDTLDDALACNVLGRPVRNQGRDEGRLSLLEAGWTTASNTIHNAALLKWRAVNHPNYQQGS
jgi:hypothetical protein